MTFDTKEARALAEQLRIARGIDVDYVCRVPCITAAPDQLEAAA